MNDIKDNEYVCYPATIEKIEELNQIYNYELSLSQMKMISVLMGKVLKQEELIDIVNIVRFIRFLRGNTSLDGITMNYTQKGISHKFKLTDKVALEMLIKVSNAMLYQLGNEAFHVNWQKNFIDGSTFFVEDYTNEELSEILQHEEQFLEKPLIFNSEAFWGGNLYLLYDNLLSQGIFGKETKTKDYSFLYDLSMLTGVVDEEDRGYSGEVGRRKFQKIKNRLKAFEVYYKKIKKKA